MENNIIYDKLIYSYSEKNLTCITTQLISLYQDQNYDALREVMSTVSKFTGIREEKIQKCFAYLLKLYHPDRTRYYKQFIRENFQAGNFNQLNGLKHIFLVEEMDFTNMRSASIDEDIDYHPEEVWDDSDPGFDIVDSERTYGQDEPGEMPVGEQGYDDFISAVKRKIYGSMEIDLPVHLLEDLDEIEMAEYEIRSLDGIRFCKYAVTMDLSGNHINDLTEIGECRRVRELYLAHNQINIIDPLGNLGELRELDLSYNQVDDLMPLSGLKLLEYLNITGNPVSGEQVKQLQKKGIIVVN